MSYEDYIKNYLARCEYGNTERDDAYNLRGIEVITIPSLNKKEREQARARKELLRRIRIATANWWIQRKR